MTVDDLKTNLKASLKDWRPRMAQAGVNSAYAFIASAALWQIVAAVTVYLHWRQILKV